MKFAKLITIVFFIFLEFPLAFGQRNKISLDGKFFKITFTENPVNANDIKNKKISYVSPTAQSENTSDLNFSESQLKEEIVSIDSTMLSNPVRSDNSLDYQMSLLNNSKALLMFENGIVNSNIQLVNGEKGYFYESKNVNGAIDFSSNNKSNVILIKGIWNGIVRGNSIKGSLTWMTDDGQKLTYTFKGTVATPRDKKVFLSKVN